MKIRGGNEGKEATFSRGKIPLLLSFLKNLEYCMTISNKDLLMMMKGQLMKEMPAVGTASL